MRVFAGLKALLVTWLAAGVAQASDFFVGEPIPKGIDLQAAASPVKETMHDFHWLLLAIITAIVVIVFMLLAYVMIRFRRSRNPVPSTTTHNVVIEVIWTAIPVLILAVIAVPSFKLLYYQDRTPQPEMTLKVVGHQWYWSYEYPDHGNFKFDARPIWDGPTTTQEQALQLVAESKPNWLIDAGAPRRLLETDNRVVVPVETNVRVLVTAADVLHSWAVPAFGVKKDAIPGRLNETWFRVDREGVYFGQCSEICGTGHGFMPIAIEAVSKERFAQWAEAAKKRFDQAN